MQGRTAEVLRVPADRVLAGTQLSVSIAIDGVDLTVIETTGSDLPFNVMPETYRQTTRGRFGPALA